MSNATLYAFPTGPVTAEPVDLTDPKVAAGMTRLIDDLDMLNFIFGALEDDEVVDLPVAA